MERHALSVRVDAGTVLLGGKSSPVNRRCAGCGHAWAGSTWRSGTHCSNPTSTAAREGHLMNLRTLPALMCVALLACALPVAFGHAQSGTLKIVVPYTPGSGPDILSRLMANDIGRAQNMTVLVENRPGGGTLVGTELVARADPDGNTVLLVGNSFAVNPAFGKGSYELRSFAPVCYLASTPLVLVVKGDSPYRTLADLLAAARTKPGELSLASEIGRASCRERV